MFDKLITTDEQLHHCFDLQLDVVIWLFGKSDGVVKITGFNDVAVRVDNGSWYVREHCTLYA